MAKWVYDLLGIPRRKPKAKKKTKKKAKKKTITITEEEKDRKMKHDFNSGRENENRRWVEAIDERIEELEKQVGIPELRLLKKQTRLRW